MGNMVSKYWTMIYKLWDGNVVYILKTEIPLVEDPACPNVTLVKLPNHLKPKQVYTVETLKAKGISKVLQMSSPALYQQHYHRQPAYSS